MLFGSAEEIKDGSNVNVATDNRRSTEAGGERQQLVDEANTTHLLCFPAAVN